MAAFFNESHHELQPETMQTLYLMNPNFQIYSQIPYLHNQQLNDMAGMQFTGLINSKYLKLAQELLDEVASLGSEFKYESMKGYVNKVVPNEGVHIEKNEKGSSELTIVERQEIQMKKAKLVNMLDEVIHRYKQYRNQMQQVMSSFEAAAGPNSAKTYTALALRTISKQFRSLKDAITGQIRAAARRLGEEESNEGGGNRKISRLQFVDQQVRQQRALQQLGMMQHNAWRPQRGLPERAVAVLRAWLFEHFLHPYPKDTDKKMLAKQTGLTRSQVSNWFINARVRLWKPMVEEMYKEEMKENENSNNSEKADFSEANEELISSKYNAQQEINEEKLDSFYSQANPVTVANYGVKFDKESINGVHENSINVGEFVDYSVGGIERFGIEQFNNVSLTLGLTNYENLSIPGAQPSYMSDNGIAFETRIDHSSAENYGFSNLNDSSIEGSKRFASQLLPDFVA